MLTPYQDSLGYWTIGVGHKLSPQEHTAYQNGITMDQAMELLASDVAHVVAALTPYSWYTNADDVRQAVLQNMAFNLGVAGLLHFPHMLAAYAMQKWVTAAAEMANSLWASQVGPRATRLEQQVITGEWQ